MSEISGGRAESFPGYKPAAVLLDVSSGMGPCWFMKDVMALKASCTFGQSTVPAHATSFSTVFWSFGITSSPAGPAVMSSNFFWSVAIWVTDSTLALNPDKSSWVKSATDVTLISSSWSGPLHPSQSKLPKPCSCWEKAPSAKASCQWPKTNGGRTNAERTFDCSTLKQHVININSEYWWIIESSHIHIHYTDYKSQMIQPPFRLRRHGHDDSRRKAVSGLCYVSNVDLVQSIALLIANVQAGKAPLQVHNHLARKARLTWVTVHLNSAFSMRRVPQYKRHAEQCSGPNVVKIVYMVIVW